MMKRIYILLAICLLSIEAFGQISKNMTLLAHWDADTFPNVQGGQYSDIWGITTPDGKEIAVIGSTPYIHFFDITNTNNLVELAHFAGGGNSLWREFKSYKDRIYAVADQGAEGLIIFDVSKAPVITKTNQTTQFFNKTHMPFIDEKNGRLYLAGSSSQSNGLIVLDLTQDPDHPTLLASVSLPGGYVHDLHVDNNIAYCSHGNNGLWVYDMTDPVNPVLLGSMTSYPESGYNHSTWINKDKKYLIQCDETHGTSVKMVDIQDLNNIHVVELFKSTLLAPGATNSIPHNPYIRGDFAFVSYYHDGIQVYTVEDPLNVKNVAYYDTETTKTDYQGFTGDWGVYPFFESDKIVCSDMLHGLFVVKLNDIDLDSIHSIGLPDVSLNYAGEARICKGDSLSLKAKSGAQFYNWYKDGVMVSSDYSFTAKDPGEYKLVAWNHSNIAESDSVVITYSDIQEPLFVDPALGICPGDTLSICSDNTAPFYQWFGNGSLLPGNEACIDITQGLKLSVRGIDGYCVKESAPIAIEQFLAPDAVITANNTIICKGDSTIILANQGAKSYHWFNNGTLIPGADSSYLLVTEQGNYSVEIDNGVCTGLSNEITVTVLQPSIFSVGFDGQVLMSMQAETYQWFFNGEPIPGATSMTYTPIESGIYYVVIGDFFGCLSKSEDILIEVTATHSPELMSVKLYPNPVQNILNVSFKAASKYTDWSIINSLGVVVQSGKFNLNTNNQLIETNILPAGTYVLNCINGSESLKLKFIRN